MSEFQDQFGRRWTIHVGGLRRAVTLARAVGHHGSVHSEGEIERPGIHFTLHGLDGRTVWSTWVPCRTHDDAVQASGDDGFLRRVVDELYYISQA